MGIVVRQGAKTGVILYVGVLIGALNNLWFFPKFLSPDQIGILRVLLANELLLFAFVQLGTTGFIDRFFPKFKESINKKSAFVQLSLLYPLLGFAVFYTLYFLFPDIWKSFFAQKSPGVLRYYHLLALLVFLFTYQQILAAFARAHFRIVIPNFLDNFLLKFLILSMIILLGWQIISFDQVILGLVLARLLNVLVLIGYLYQLIPEKIQWGHSLSKSEVKEIITYGLYIVIGGASVIIISNFDTVMIASLIGTKYAGIYTIAFFIGTVVEMPRRALGQIAVPVISSAWQKNDLAAIKEIYQKTSINQLIAGAWALMLILGNIQDLFLIMPKGEVYAQGLYVVVFIGLARFIDMSIGTNHEILLYSKYYKFNLLSNVFLASIMIGLNAVLIPIYQLNGAAFATLFSLIIFNIIRFVFLWVKYKIQPFTSKTLWALLVIGGTVTITYFLTSLYAFPPIINIIVTSIIISSLFGTGVLALKLSEDLNQLILKVYQMIRRKRS
ncbi:hypothetical protein BKI52_08005 [marine bacterium AO1-C]|nr:hypothetical protein BKI52_08005 [marine bacterium AO1-C]